MSFSLQSTDDNRESLKVFNAEYSIERDGHRYAEPIVHLYCRDGDDNRRTVHVDGFYPYFYIRASEFADKTKQVLNGNTIRYIEVPPGETPEKYRHNTFVRELDERYTTLDGEAVVRITTIEPKHVAELRDYFDTSFEADVFFTNRFCIHNDIYQYVDVPADRDRFSLDELRSTEHGPEIEPRISTVDIEVWSGDGFPEPEYAEQPITCLTEHDNYTDEYTAWILRPWKNDNSWPNNEPAWSMPDKVDEADVRVFDDEGEMLQDYIDHLVDNDPDFLSGWNSSRNDIGSGFDYPYIINRCKNLNVWGIEDLSPMEQVFVSERGTPVVKGRTCLDGLQSYKKTQIHEKESYSLNDIAQNELGYGKEDIDSLDEGWLHEPTDFLQYNIRDVQATVDIREVKSTIDIFDHIRSIAGAPYSEIPDSNYGIIDPLFLREAKDRGYVLPTATPPSVKYYWGAKVFEPSPGKHRNVLYPDLSSLYPNLLRYCNLSPETIVGFEEDLEQSEYCKDDCHTMYVDPRDESVKKNSESIERVPFYVLKPDVKQSFISDVTGDLIDMKYEYKSDEYSDEAYAAIKRVTNSVYGVLGDSDSYGTGFRLFDWRIAEAVTLAGRDVITHTAETFADRVRSMGYPDAEIAAGDTDSAVCTIPSADGIEESLDVAMTAAEYVNSTYDEFMGERFGIDEHGMEVEIESYAETAFFRSKKKRYAEWIRWDEGEYVDEVELTGFEAVRSDSSNVTERVQTEMLTKLLKSDDEFEEVMGYLSDERQRFLDGEYSLDEIGIPKAISSDPQDYGWGKYTSFSDSTLEQQDGELFETAVRKSPDFEWSDSEQAAYKFWTAQPHVRGIRYANAHIDGEHIGSGDKPLFFYLDGVDCDCDEGGENRSLGDSSTKRHPSVYQYDISLNVPADVPQSIPELGRAVDACCVEDTRHFPDCCSVDYERMCEKAIRSPNESIIEDMGWSWDDVVSESTQSGLAEFM